MGVEIGSLVVRGSFSAPSEKPQADPEGIRDEIQHMRLEILHEVRNMLAEMERRRSDR